MPTFAIHAVTVERASDRGPAGGVGTAADRLGLVVARVGSRAGSPCRHAIAGVGWQCRVRGTVARGAVSISGAPARVIRAAGGCDRPASTPSGPCGDTVPAVRVMRIVIAFRAFHRGAADSLLPAAAPPRARGSAVDLGRAVGNGRALGAVVTSPFAPVVAAAVVSAADDPPPACAPPKPRAWTTCARNSARAAATVRLIVVRHERHLSGNHQVKVSGQQTHFICRTAL